MDQMEQTSSQAQASTQSPINVSTALQTGEQVLDSATIAAQAIAGVSGLNSLEAIATFLLSLHSRVQALEQAAPAVQSAVDAASAVVASIPEGFVERVEGFFGRHFPSHAAPAASVTDATKTE